jgi:hypothetical protein
MTMTWLVSGVERNTATGLRNFEMLAMLRFGIFEVSFRLRLSFRLFRAVKISIGFVKIEDGYSIDRKCVEGKSR